MSVIDTRPPRAVKVDAGREFTAMTGRRQRETQVACAKKATANLGALLRMSLKRLSSPSERMRWKR
jgi:hypothetical protein